jgi:hypothetical protein
LEAKVAPNRQSNLAIPGKSAMGRQPSERNHFFHCGKCIRRCVKRVKKICSNHRGTVQFSSIHNKVYPRYAASLCVKLFLRTLVFAGMIHCVLDSHADIPRVRCHQVQYISIHVTLPCRIEDFGWGLGGCGASEAWFRFATSSIKLYKQPHHSGRRNYSIWLGLGWMWCER